MLMAAPADLAITQNDCDCACPAIPAPAISTHALHDGMRLRLHPHATFMELGIENAECRIENAECRIENEELRMQNAAQPSSQFSILNSQLQ
jgi:hypothetical protein